MKLYHTLLFVTSVYRIVKRGVEKFFGIADNDEKWNANASRMHAESVVLRPRSRKTKPVTAAGYALGDTNDVEQPIQLQRMQTYAAEPGRYDTVDSSDTCTTSVSHGAPHPLDPLAKPLVYGLLFFMNVSIDEMNQLPRFSEFLHQFVQVLIQTKKEIFLDVYNCGQ